MWSSWLPFGRGASSSSHANFLHLSRTNIESMREDLRKSSTSHEQFLNPHQCLSMSCKLETTMRSIQLMVDSSQKVSKLVCGSAVLESFYRVSEKAKLLVENCCSKNWCPASVFQIQNEEAFKEILLEASLCYNTICRVVEDINKKFLYEDLCKSSTFDPPSADEVSKDLVALQDRLKGLVNATSISSASHIRSQHLGKYLLGRVAFALQHTNDEDFDVRNFNLWSDGNGPVGEWSPESELLGGNVCKTTWLDVRCAKKFFKDEMQEDEWLAEAKILASLNHPNIVKFICCNKYETEYSWGYFIAMEQMETSLGSFIRRLKKEGAQLSLFLALDIILQIAHGMCYLHDNGIAHRDLKTSNVVVRRLSDSKSQYYLQAKVVDFGISKVKLQVDKSNTITRPKTGTTVYMPPEAFTNGRADWFKADVYSFSVMCSVILSGDEPFQGIKRDDLYGAICNGIRPKLPGDIPEELEFAIEKGWATDRNLRPSFIEMCTKLEKIRHWALRNHCLGLSFKELHFWHPSANEYIVRMLKMRSQAREHARSHVRAHTPTNSTDGDEVLKSAAKMLPQKVGSGSQASPSFRGRRATN